MFAGVATGFRGSQTVDQTLEPPTLTHLRTSRVARSFQPRAFYLRRGGGTGETNPTKQYESNTHTAVQRSAYIRRRRRRGPSLSLSLSSASLRAHAPLPLLPISYRPPYSPENSFSHIAVGARIEPFVCLLLHCLHTLPCTLRFPTYPGESLGVHARVGAWWLIDHW